MANRIYQLLLYLLPRTFREEFGREMSHTFAASGGSLLVNAGGVVALAVRLRADQLRMDLRHSLRGLLRQNTFTVTAVMTLALAFGPATAVFTLVTNVMLDPLPGAIGLDRVIDAYAANPSLDRHQFPWAELNFIDHRERKQGLTALAAYAPTSATIGGESPQQVEGAWVSVDMFDVLGIAPAQGRRFVEADTQPGAPLTVILGHDYAAARFAGGDPIGQTLMMDGRATTVIGVLPRGFRFPEGEENFWQPLVINRKTSSRGQNYLRVMGRLADGVTIETVEQQMNAVAIDLEKQYPEYNTGSRVEVVPVAHELTRTARRVASILGVAALAILLLACTNIASLLVVRTAARQEELAVRTALGASAARLSRQLLIEHLLLAAIGAVAAIGVAALLLRLLSLSKLVPAVQLERVTLGVTPLLFLVALTTLTATALGWLVSRRATRMTAMTTARTQSASRETVRLRQALVGIEVGAAVVLLVAAGLMLKSASRLLAVDTGFRTENVITFQLGLPMSRYMEPKKRVAFIEAVVEKLSQLPGVSVAASGAYGPMGSMRATRRFAIDGKPLPEPGTEPLAIDFPAGPAYARVVGLRVIDGRWIDERDRIDAPPVVVISEEFAKQYFPGERAVGHRLRYYNARASNAPPPTPEIVGVVSDVRQFGVAEREAPQMYVPHAQRAWTFTSFFVRTADDPRAVISSLPAAVHTIDPERPLEHVRTLDELVDDSTADRRALAALLGMAALIAVLISTIGVYGVTAATTATRKRELAIRAAIGADRSRLIMLVVRQALIASTLGVAAGLIGGVAASSVLKSVLYEVQARDPWTFAAAASGLAMVCIAATYLPARRALRENPAALLRGN